MTVVKTPFFLCLLALVITLALPAAPAMAQSNSCTNFANNTSQDITAHGVCKKVTFSTGPAPSGDVGSVCAVTGTTLAEWQSFYKTIRLPA